MIAPIVSYDNNITNYTFVLNPEYTELFTYNTNSDVYLKYLSTLVYDSNLQYTSNQESSDNPTLYEESDNIVNLKLIRESIYDLTLDINSSRNPISPKGVFRFNNETQELLTNQKYSGISKITDLKINTDFDFIQPSAKIILNKYNDKLVKFKDGDYIDINGLKIFFKDEPNLPNHIKITQKPKDDFLNLYNTILILNDPRLKHDVCEYTINDNSDEITISTNDFSINIESSFRNVQNDVYYMFNISQISGNILEVYVGYSETPIITNQQMLNGSIDINPNLDLYLGVKFVRKTNDETNWIIVKDVTIITESEYNTSNVPQQVFKKINETLIVSPVDQYKVYKLNNFKVTAQGITDNRYLSIDFRYSDNNGRNQSTWRELTSSNLQALKINPIGFFKIEYKVTRIGSDQTGIIILFNIELIGDFINIDCDYMKMGILGLNTCCNNNTNVNDGCENKPNPQENMDTDPSLKQNPYAKTEALTLYQRRMQTITDTFGQKVDYYKTTPDQKGNDYILHEYQLANTIDKKTISVIVPNNQFPDRKFQITPFTMDFLDSFIINISKEEFKKNFGLTSRPDKDDVIIFCQNNRLYQVSQANPLYDFMNSSTMYEVVLHKYEDKMSRGGGVEELELELKALTEFNTLDMFDDIQIEEENHITKDTFQPLTREQARAYTHDDVSNLQELFEVQSNLISRYQYDLTKIKLNDVAVEYFRKETPLAKGQNRSQVFWFNIQQNIGSNRLILNSLNQSIYLQGQVIHFKINEQLFKLDCTGMTMKKQHACIINLNQTAKELEMTVFTFKDTKSPIKPVYQQTFRNVKPESFDGVGNNYELVPIDVCNNSELIIEGDISSIKLYGGPHYITNIRIFKSEIPKDKYIQVLQQYTVIDSEQLLLVDNTQPIQILPNHGMNQNSQK